MNSSNFRSLLILYASYAWFSKVSSSIIPAYLLGRGVGVNQMFLANALSFLLMIFVLLFVRIKSAKLSWRLAIVALMISVLSIVNIQFSFQIYLTYIFGGIALALFFVYYNIGHFLYTPKGKTGVSGGVMYAVGPAISIFAPIIAGYLATTNIYYLWALSIASFILAFSLTFRQTDFSMSYNLVDSLNSIRSTRIPIFLEGIWESVLFAFIPLSTLHFITSLDGYGRYLGYLSLIGTIAGLLIGHYSDRLGKRSFLLTPICIILSLATMSLIFGLQSLPIWIIVTSTIQFVVPVFWNIITALMVDQNLDLKIAFPGREIVLATGRMIGLGFTYLCVKSDATNLLLITLSVVILLIPIYLYYESKITRRFLYQ